MTERRPTIIDVAREAGVSKSTVSLVLRDSPLVRDETRENVRAAMERLNYVYHRGAASLRAQGTGLIGLVINDLRNPFFTEFAISLQMALSAQGYATVIANTDEDSGLQSQVIGAMVEHDVAAVIISPCYGGQDAGFGALARAGIPTLQVLRQVAGADDFPFAAPDYREGGRRASEHLIAAGARRIAFVGGVAGRSVVAERMSGYLEVLARHGLDPVVMHGPSTRGFGRAVADRLTGARPGIDAAICFSDLIAHGVLSRLAETGHKVGAGGLRLIGFDDIEESATSYPPLSSVSCRIDGFGRSVAAMVLGWLRDGRRPPPETRMPAGLILRQSSPPP
ncbi:MAG: LacI family DNA-binding transcriptional regulator [Paracoccus sp. (in: a-proteobacteria)]|nr:LacI family DNA-binding transcriptional regulator [Paracoccus sp. (in: a-proteobacteria)]